MKTPYEISKNSMTMIEERFSKLLGAPVWVPDWNKEDQKNQSEAKAVLVMGNFYKRIFQKEYWPQHPFSLYCLSNAVKDVLCELFFFEDKYVSVVPRYELFKRSENAKSFPLKDFQLVHAGRISPQKNIEFIIFFNFYLQMIHSPSIGLNLLGNFDNEYHHNATGFMAGNYQDKIERLIASLPWLGERPKFFHDLDSEEWLQTLPEASLLMSASSLISEDLGVSFAQGQELGYPLLLPNWGGLKDIKGTNVKFYSSSLIAASHESLKSMAQKALALAQHFHCNEFLVLNNEETDKPLTHPEAIDQHYLEAIYQKNKAFWGEGVNHIAQDEFHLFMATPKAEQLFKKFHEIFAR